MISQSVSCPVRRSWTSWCKCVGYFLWNLSNGLEVWSEPYRAPISCTEIAFMLCTSSLRTHPSTTPQCFKAPFGYSPLPTPLTSRITDSVRFRNVTKRYVVCEIEWQTVLLLRLAKKERKSKILPIWLCDLRESSLCSPVT